MAQKTICEKCHSEMIFSSELDGFKCVNPRCNNFISRRIHSGSKDKNLSKRKTAKYIDEISKNKKIVIFEYANHPAVSARNRGDCGTLTGKVLIINFFISDGIDKWTENEKNKYIEDLAKVKERLEDEASAYEKLKIEYKNEDITLENKFDKVDNKWIDELLNLLGVKTTSDYIQKIKSIDDSYKEVALCFIFNKDFRSYAYLSKNKGISIYSQSESSIIGVKFSNDFVRTYIHELFHQFGAYDLYYPDEYKKAAELYLKDSIMNGGLVFDDLTKYVIGWTKKKTKNMLNFLEDTKFITDDDIEEARKKA